MLHQDLINHILRVKKYASYLEIGCQTDVCFGVVEAPHKVGVDPVSGGTMRMTSDEFFTKSCEKFDLIFIDGLHHHDQVQKDLGHSLKALAKGGMIAMHDCFPPTLLYETEGYCHTAWRAFASFRHFPQLDMIVGNFDFGIGLVRLGENQNPADVPPMNSLQYADMVLHADDWMNVRTLEEAILWIEKK